MNIALLKTELDTPQYANLSPTDAAQQLNAPTIEYFAEVPTAELTNFLMNSGLYAKLLAVYRDHPVLQIRVVAEGALALSQSQIPVVNLQNATIQQTLPALVAGGVWTQAEADSMLNFAKRTKSRAQQLLGEPVTEADINAARLLDKAQSEIETLESLRAQVSQLEYRQAQFRQGIDPDNNGEGA
ncbi:hypothetical protein EON83_30535 [bacterium]|nr:MAG: hypothetical protein EON83_30535 [bacterium]